MAIIQPDNNIQDGALAILCWNDTYCKSIANLGYEIYHLQKQVVAKAAIKYIEDYKKAPKEVLASLLNLKTEPASAQDAYVVACVRQLDALKTINPNYILDNLQLLQQRAELSPLLVKAGQLLNSPNQNSDELNNEIRKMVKVLRTSAKLFRPGLILGDAYHNMQSWFSEENVENIETGIDILDKYRNGPSVGGLHLFMALPKRGKSWWLVNLGVGEILKGYKVLHVTLEMSEELVAQRYLQAFSQTGVYDYEIIQAHFEKNELGYLANIKVKKEYDEIALKSKNTEKQRRAFNQVMDRMCMIKNKAKGLIIRQWATGSMSVGDLEAHLDILAERENFRPHLLIVDYADLMTLDPRNYRHSLGELYKELRGLAVKYNLAVATASQANRTGINAKFVSEEHIAEDFSKIATADVVVAYSQTKTEKLLNLARLSVVASRSGKDKQNMLISQNYNKGVFCVDCVHSSSGDLDIITKSETNAFGSNRNDDGEF